MLGGALMIIGATIQTTSKNLAWFLGGRALVGFGGGFCNNANPLMVIELCYPSQRAPIAGSYNSFTQIGAIGAAIAVFGCYYLRDSDWSWRLPLLIQVVPTAIQWSLIMFGPESPRWLIGKGRDEEALRILAKYHGDGNPEHPLVVYEFEEMKNAISNEEESKAVWSHLFKTRGMRKRSFTMICLAICGQWSGYSMVSYYLNQVLTTVGLTDRPVQLGINISISLLSFICGFIAGLNADRFGRRPIFLISIYGMLACFTSVTICTSLYVESHSAISGKLTVVFVCKSTVAALSFWPVLTGSLETVLFTGFYSFGWASVLLLYITEIVPFSIRSKAHSLFAITQASMQTFNQYVNPIAFLAMGWKYYIVFDCFIVCIGCFVYFCVPETKGHTLEETALLFDGQDAVAQLQFQADIQAGGAKAATEDHTATDDQGPATDNKHNATLEHYETVQRAERDEVRGGTV